jgi:putative peptidoglycan lipid II flippase
MPGGRPPGSPVRGNTPHGLYQPDAPTIEMPAIGEPMVLGDSIRIERPPTRPPERPAPPTDREVQRERSQRASALVAAGIFLSRIAGLLREMVISNFLGVSATADAFKAALRIPNMLQNLLGEGVLSASFIPVYARLRSEGNEEEAGRVAGAIAGLLVILTGVLSVVGVLFAEPITRLLVFGFTGGARFELTVELTRIMFPGVGFLVLSAWCLGVLNSHRRFFLSYVAPVLWNVAQIVAVVAVATTTESPRSLAVALAWGVLVGGVLQFLVQLGPVRGLLGRIRLTLDVGRTSVRSVLRRFGPVLMGRGVVQVLAFVDLALAAYLVEGAVAALTYGQVLYLLPISMFGMSVAAAELPDLSEVEVYDPDTRRTFRRRLEDGMARISFYVMPTAALFIVVGDVIVAAIFQRGDFTAADTWVVWLVLAAFALGLPATTSSRLLQNGLYALDDAKTPARLAVIRVAIAAVVGAALMFPLDRLFIGPDGIAGWSDMWAFRPLPVAERNDSLFPHLGIVALALGASLAAWIEYRMLSRALAWRIGRTRLAGRWLNPIALSCAAVAAMAYAIVIALPDVHPIVAAPVVLAPSGIVYLGLTRWLQVPEAVSLTRRLSRLTSAGRR